MGLSNNHSYHDRSFPFQFQGSYSSQVSITCAPKQVRTLHQGGKNPPDKNLIDHVMLRKLPRLGESTFDG